MKPASCAGRTRLRIPPLFALILLPAYFFLLAQSSYAEAARSEAEGIESLRAAVASAKGGRHDQAIFGFKKAYETLPPVRDYTLLFMARSQAASSKNADAIKTIAKLRKDYPRTTLMREARRLEAEVRLKGDWRLASKSVLSYIAEYPSDMQMRYDYAMRMKSLGRTGEADAEFRAIYVNAGARSSDSFAQMSNKSLSAQDKFTRASNLFMARDYASAEPLLKEIMQEKSLASRKKSMEDLLGSALFRQRKYTEAATFLLDSGDLYNGAKAQLRSGQEYEFYKTVDRMIEERHKQTAELLIALSADMRRDGNAEDAMMLIEETLSLFPEAREDALWQKGWQLYMRGRHKEARDIFRSLHEAYNEDRYAYWMGRAEQRLGLDPSRSFSRIEPKGYYGIMARLASGEKSEEAASAIRKPHATYNDERIGRVDILLDAGLLDEAAEELVRMSKRTSSASGLLSIAYRLQRARHYREAMIVADMLPEHRRPVDLMYPLAFWESVSREAAQHSVDPIMLLSLMREESRFASDALSPVGAIGLMQLMPATAANMARASSVKISCNDDIFDVDNNIALGTKYLGRLFGEFEAAAPSLAAYNAGESRVRQWLRSGRYDSYDEFVEDIPFKETRNYVKRIISSYHYYLGSPLPDSYSCGTGRIL